MLPHKHSHKHLHTQTHAHEFIASPWQCLVNQNQGQTEFIVHTRTQRTQTRLQYTDTHISCLLFPYFYLVQEFAAPAVKFLRSFSVTENEVFTLLTVFDIQRNSWGGDGFSTNAYKQHKHKGYKIFMELKQGWEVQCKQIN